MIAGQVFEFGLRRQREPEPAGVARDWLFFNNLIFGN
jgi:hypothetical protein